MDMIKISDLSRVPIAGSYKYPLTRCILDSECSGLKVADWSGFYSKRYAGMDPVNCIGFQNSGDISFDKYFCFVRVGKMILYPVINHYNGCNCEAVSTDSNLALLCNQQNLLTSLIFLPHENIDSFPITLGERLFILLISLQSSYMFLIYRGSCCFEIPLRQYFRCR